jgi:hypothetical protein
MSYQVNTDIKNQIFELVVCSKTCLAINLITFYDIDLTNTEFKNKWQQTLLHAAVINRNYELVTYLIEHKMDYNIVNRFGMTAMDYAMEYKDVRMVGIMLDNNNIINKLVNENHILSDSNRILQKENIMLKNNNKIFNNNNNNINNKLKRKNIIELDQQNKKQKINNIWGRRVITSWNPEFEDDMESSIKLSDSVKIVLKLCLLKIIIYPQIKDLVVLILIKYFIMVKLILER